jgi:hypothetical protein
MACLALGASEKPLQYRELPWDHLKGLKIDSQYENEPIIARSGVQYFGVAVYNRSAGAVLQLNSATYSNPTIS